jgi:Uncharacterised nucleotidyltransferase
MCAGPKHVCALKSHHSAPFSSGQTIAALLSSAWRATPEPITGHLAQRFQEGADLLLGTGCGGLGWWRIRMAELPPTAATDSLRQAFRLHALEAAQHERTLRHVLGHFNQAGLVPIIFKGWTLTHFYAQPALRPYGDIDVLVSQTDEQRAREVLASLPESDRAQVDLDMKVLGRFLPDRSFDSLLARASSESLGNVRYRLLAPEDHLRLVCLHQLHHGGWRPLWLCDVAALVEGLPTGFSWERCLEGNRRLSDSVIALIALAEELLGARLPAGAPRRSAPSWFRVATLRAWGEGYRPPPASLHSVRRLGWRGTTAALRARWPDPISSTLHLRAPFRGIPRFALQVAESARRASLFFVRRWRNGVSSFFTVAGHGQGVLL